MHTKCKDCSDKREGCHSRCPYYIAQKMLQDELYAARKKQKMKDDQMFEGIKRSKAKANKGGKRK